MLSFEWLEFPSAAPADEATLTAWEHTTGVRLPADYRRFLLLTNGGCLRPYMFDATIPNVDETTHVVETVYGWFEALDNSQYNTKPSLRTAPPDCLCIGYTNTRLRITISLDSTTSGAIALWPYDMLNPWGSEYNRTHVSLAPSFTHFLALLRHDEHREGYHYAWQCPSKTEYDAIRITLPGPSHKSAYTTP